MNEAELKLSPGSFINFRNAIIVEYCPVAIFMYINVLYAALTPNTENIFVT